MIALTRRWTRRAFCVSLVAEQDGRGQLKLVSRDGISLAGGRRYLQDCAENNKTENNLKLTLQGETVQRLCDGLQYEGCSLGVAGFGDNTPDNGDLWSTKLQGAERANNFASKILNRMTIRFVNYYM